MIIATGKWKKCKKCGGEATKKHLEECILKIEHDHNINSDSDSYSYIDKK